MPTTKALVVDDSHITRRVIALSLRSQQIDCRIAQSGQDGLSILQREPAIKFVLLDWNMPEMNGLEFLKTVRRNASFQHLKLFVITASDTKATAQQAMDHGATDLIVKPISPKQVAAKLAEHGLN